VTADRNACSQAEPVELAGKRGIQGAQRVIVRAGAKRSERRTQAPIDRALAELTVAIIHHRPPRRSVELQNPIMGELLSILQVRLAYACVVVRPGKCQAG